VNVERNVEQEQKNAPNVVRGSEQKNSELPDFIQSLDAGYWTSPRVFHPQVHPHHSPQEKSPQKLSENKLNMKDLDSASTPLSQSKESKTQNLESSGEQPEEACKTSSNTSIKINFKRKICPEPYLIQLLETFKQENMITGNAFHMVLSDLLNLRRMCEAIQLARKNGDQNDMNSMVDMLDLIL
jgi:hypothetical protein